MTSEEDQEEYQTTRQQYVKQLNQAIILDCVYREKSGLITYAELLKRTGIKSKSTLSSHLKYLRGIRFLIAKNGVYSLRPDVRTAYNKYRGLLLPFGLPTKSRNRSKALKYLLKRGDLKVPRKYRKLIAKNQSILLKLERSESN